MYNRVQLAPIATSPCLRYKLGDIVILNGTKEFGLIVNFGKVPSRPKQLFALVLISPDPDMSIGHPELMWLMVEVLETTSNQAKNDSQ